jgi:hypothetical protein
MDESTTIYPLEELAEGFGIQIRYEAINLDEESTHVTGGLCQLRGRHLIIINSRSTMRERIQTLAEALNHFDLERVYIKPALRELLNREADPSIMPKTTEEKHSQLNESGDGESY